MGLSNCKQCGKLFLKTKLDICDDCIQKEQDLIQRINDYVVSIGKDDITIEEIAIQFRVSPDKLERFLIERKLVQIMDKLLLKCKSCGVEFKLSNEGRLHCKKCSEKMETGLGGSQYNAVQENSYGFNKNQNTKYSFKSNRNF